MLLTLALGLVLCAAGDDASPSRLAVIRQAPDFTLTNQDGKTFKLSDYKGKVMLVSFVFTTCNGSCPATTHRLAKVQAVIKQRYSHLNLGRDYQPEPVVLLSITLDPQRDTPEALKKYIKLYDLETEAKKDQAGNCPWVFLTGSPETVARTIAAWGMWVKPAANGQLDHPSRIFLVDTELRIREVYNVDMLRPADVLEDIELLWSEKRK
jgi:protein SCO1